MTKITRKRFGQHWLQSEVALKQIIGAAELKKEDKILEIGPGTGILTRRLLPEVQKVVSVEIDRDLCKNLVKKLGNEENFVLLQGDFLSVDLNQLLQPFPSFQNPNKVVANIPYNITGPILEKLLGRITEPTHPSYDLIVLLIQKEVAERIVAQAGTKIFGALSVRLQYLAECEWIADVPAKAFYPPPKVDSAIIRLRPRILQPGANNPRWLETLVKVGFANKRKMLRNNLKSLDKNEQLSSILETLKIDSQARAEDLNVQDWITLSNQIQ